MVDIIRKLIPKSLLVLAIVSIATVSIHAMPPPDERSSLERQNGGAKSLAAEPTSIDGIFQNKGNIVTLIENWGYVGGYKYNLPSGEWPRNSGHSYLAEILYWVGGVTAAGDTLMVNSTDDMQAIKMPVNGTDQYRVLLSTDTSRYIEYDETDTVGLGLSNPAFGWRVWDPISESWEYNQPYNSLTSDFVQAGPTSLQDSHYRMNDVALGSSLLGLEMTHTVLQWNYCYNEDFMFVLLEITNTSVEDYTDFAFGLYCDIDVGGDDGMGSNGRQEDMVAYDTTENLAYIYDNIGIDPGWGPTVKTGVMGTKLLETPNDIGMTAFRTDDWAYLPTDDAGRFAMANSTQFDAPLPPTDQFYVQCVRGIDLPAGSTVRVVYALIAGADPADFEDNAAMAQELYDYNFVGPQPPPTPSLSARASDSKVYLYWNDTSEVGVDPLTLVNDFAGYKLYRSDNQGKTWGNVIWNTGNDCLDVDYTPLAAYSVINPGDPMPHSFIDTGLYNGVEYWYCLSAFDTGDSTMDPLQSGFGLAGQSENVIAVTPRSNSAGFYEASATVTHDYLGTDNPSDGEVIPVVFDQTATAGGEFQVVFSDGMSQSYWHLINVGTGDTVLADQTATSGDPNLEEIVDGIRVLVYDGELEPRSLAQTGFGGSDTTLALGTYSGPVLPYWTGVPDYAFGREQYRGTYELRYSTDPTMAVSLWEGFDGVPYAQTPVPFEVWNTSTNQRVSLMLDEWPVDGAWDAYSDLIVVNVPYDPLGDLTASAFPYIVGWRFSLDADSFAPVEGDVFTIEGAPVNGPDDVFSFKIDGVNSTAAGEQMQNIRVVPNPYFVQYSSMVETSEGESVLQFQKLPDRCTIRIYNLAGDLIRTLDHSDDDGSGTCEWDLRSSAQRLVASGMYLYHVESDYGDFLGRFAVVK